MNVLILGSGGREHTFAWKIAQSDALTNLFIAPGNAGTAQCGTNVAIKETDFPAIHSFVNENNIELVIVGPEAPLVAGIQDYFLTHDDLTNIPVIGPSKAGAQLEGSKDFSKQFMGRHNIPTAQYQTFDQSNLEEGLRFLETLNPPYVLKADGLAAGKGVLIIDQLEEAKTELKHMIADSKFGEASQRVVIEEFLDGIELSVFVLTDGNSYKILPEAKDYKRIGEGDTGLNTGGMGAVSPVPFAGSKFLNKVESQIVKPTVDGLKQEGIRYSGFIFIGLMNVNGDPYVIEYNVRMGDPETEVVLPRIKSDLLKTLVACGKGQLEGVDFEIDERAACTVMAVSGGYPQSYDKGKEITGLDRVTDSILFHAGTKLENGKVVTSGGRVIAVTSFGADRNEALKKSYASLNQFDFEKRYFRSDIGQDLED